MKIDLATEKEMSALCDLFNASRSANGSFPAEQYSVDKFLAESEGEEVLVARLDNELLGFASVWAADSFLHHLYISPSHQSKGVGKKLLQECVNRFGLPMSLKCLKENTKACQFYERLGWQAAEENSGPEGTYLLYLRTKKD